MLATLTDPVSCDEDLLIGRASGGGQLSLFRVKMFESFPKVYLDLFVTLVNAQLQLGLWA